MRILVTGASGFAGSQLIPRLRSDGHTVRALARDPARVDVTSVADVFTGDVLAGEGLAAALEGVEVAYYLIHSMERTPAHEHIGGGRGILRGGRAIPFPERERRAATHFASGAAEAGVRRIVYLGGPTASWTTAGGRASERDATDDGGDYDYDSDSDGDGDALSPHLASREAVERILREAVADTVTLRASIVIGAGSRSFRFLVRLIERMPVLALPSWRVHRTRPIDARDVTNMLAAAATVTSVAGRSLDVGGPDVLSYGEMIRRIAELMLLARPAMGLGVSVTPLTARVAAAIAEEDPELVSALMESLRGDLLPDGPHGRAHLHAAELLGVDLHSFDAAVERSLREWESAEPLAAR